VAVRRNEQAAVFHEGHVREVKRALVFDRKGQQSGLAAWLTHYHPKFTRRDISIPKTISSLRLCVRYVLQQGDQPGFEGQLALQRRASELCLEGPKPVDHPVEAAYVQRARKAWQVRTSR